MIGIDVADRGFGDVKHDLSALRQAAGDQVLQYLMLRINNDPLAAGQALDIDVMALPVPLQGYAIVEMALPHHAVPQAEVDHQFDDPVFQNASPDRLFHIGTATGFDDDAADAKPVQQVREEQSRRATADDADLGAHDQALLAAAAVATVTALSRFRIRMAF